ncbi:centrosomal protein 43 isoform X1 [Chanos chanos]|uniref:Centrosomal protein 43 n=1 Tax=Chanos chanos TaxID=29144 RepID=A0A6J2V476_CHACN|nr:FGFR1 oncogene partner isoform X1 [Chanos chanos]
MSATDEDTELRDLLIQNLENNGVLNKIKAELRAAVFLALEEQDKVENKTPLVNQSLKKCLNTKDGRLVASLITDFLQVFNLDFTLAVFQPEINTLNGLDSRETVSRELGISESEVNKNTPLLLELVKRGRHKEKPSVYSEGDRATHLPKDLSPGQIAEVRRKFDMQDKDRNGGVSKEGVIAVFADLVPCFSRGMLEQFVTDELRTKDKSTGHSLDFQEFLGMYKQFFGQCRSVVSSESNDATPSSGKSFEERFGSSPGSKIPRYRGFLKQSAVEQRTVVQGSDGSHSNASGTEKSRGQVHVTPGITEGIGDAARNASVPLRRSLDLGDEDEDEEEGDSFFDDPLPKPQKTYGCRSSAEKRNSGMSLSEKSYSAKDLSAICSDIEADGEEVFSDAEVRGGRVCEARRAAEKSLSSLSASPPLRSCGEQRDHAAGRNGSLRSKDSDGKDVKTRNEKTGSPMMDEDIEYDDDFNSHQSENSKSEVSIGEEIEEVSIEGPDISDKLDDMTQDVSVSQISQEADYMEEVA